MRSMVEGADAGLGLRPEAAVAPLPDFVRPSAASRWEI